MQVPRYPPPTRQRLQQTEDRASLQETRAREAEDKLKAATERIAQLQVRKSDLKLLNESLEASNEQFKEQSEKQYAEIRVLKGQLQSLAYLQKLQQIIEEHNDEAHVKQIRALPNPQRQAQEFYDLYQLKCSQMKGMQQEHELLQ